MSRVADYAGVTVTAVLALGLLAVLVEWRISLRLSFRIAVIALGAAAGPAIYILNHRAPPLSAWAWIALIALLTLVHAAFLIAALSRSGWGQEELADSSDLHPLLREALSYERNLSYPAAVIAYDQYLEECPSDVRAKGRLGEALIKAGNAKRAISVLTLAFTEAEEAKMKIAFGIRLAELILVTQRDPLAARAQLELLRKLYAGTEHEKYVERLSRKMMKAVSEGRYLKKRPRRY